MANRDQAPLDSIDEARRRMNDEAAEFDELGLDIHLLGLMELILNRVQPPLVIGVHGDWGSGKTSFMQVLRNLLDDGQRAQYGEAEEAIGVPEDERLSQRAEALIERWKEGIRKEKGPVKGLKPEILTVWFNPWEHQFEDEPVLPLLDAIRNQQASGWSNVTDGFRKIVEDPKFRIIGKAAMGVAKMAGPGWFSALSQQIGDEAKQIMDRFSRFQKEFHACMRDLTANSGGKMVIFIDDLDRCEPEYVLKILESLKLHLRNPHSIFVLGCANARVKEHLKSKLIREERMERGSKDDGVRADQHAEEYLEKIVQLPFHLPGMHPRSFERLLKHLGWEHFTRDHDPDAYALLHEFAEDNPRRLKRFSRWYNLQRSMIDMDPKLKEMVGSAWDRETHLLKFMLLRFLDPDYFTETEDFLRNATEIHAEQPEEDKSEGKKPPKRGGEA